ncbi:uroporphyrinogen-III C-methyltransferase [Phaeodactylibacter xiamenensis]|uniref:uroporphyrinogen-III C-methyltransferase n=1 Tax=Phaeodactylibacter xiamenensis TaxID=1524460 RepID=UPI003BA962AB
MNKEPKITLVGAGPGDPELLTLKGARALRTADVILYDALIDTRLLNHARPEAPRIFVGKRAGAHRMSQEEINTLLVKSAKTHGHAVRLKGGDAFVFGRGKEETAYAQEQGIPVEIVPGISSCIALPELQQVPPTSRGYSESFWVITGTTRSGGLSGDIALAAKSTATVIVLMGMRKATAIAQEFIKQGKADLPAMVISKGSTADERRVLGTAATLPALIEAAALPRPGILVFGEVVRLHPNWNYQAIAAEQPLKERA